MKAFIEHLFHAVADLSAEEREQYFVEHEIETNTRAEVCALLTFDSNASSSLHREIGVVAERALARMDPKDIPCGQFRLGELLGRGGMGAVYLAERVDGEVAQRVAIKLLRPGADDPHQRQRFLEERQILANLDHPHVARLLDAGHREDGQPYLAMEYVNGKPIDVFAASMSVRQRLNLFLKVCGAVSYLHRNLVVHRDLKPSNILVTEEGEPKLLDFGLAKMLDLSTDSTVTSLRMLTPDYASPEQVVGGPVTTATDIYSLGAVLYKLLTGECAHKFGSDSASAIAVTISGGKIVPPSKLAPEIKSDLEFILMKALRGEPQDRYSTIDQFSEDIENFLESRPIRARKGDAWYRTRKYVRRHWFPVAAASLAIAGLSTGLIFANRERNVAQRRFVEVRQLANKLFDIDLEVRKVPGNTKARQLIVDTSLDYLRQLSSDAHGDPDLALELGNAYMRVARVQGVPIASNLGQLDQADQNLQIAEKLIGSVLTARPANRIAMLRAAQIAHDRMILARFNSHHDKALGFARTSAAWLAKFNAGDADKAEVTSILNTYINVADQHMLSRQYDEALALCRRGSELARAFHHAPYLGTLLWVSADVFRREGNLDEALKEILESVKVLDPGSAEVEQGRVMNYVFALIHEGWILGDDEISLGRSDEALPVMQRAFKIADEFVHKDASDSNSRGRLAVAGLGAADLLRHSDPRQSLAMYDHVLLHVGEINNNASFRRFEASALAGSSYALRQLGRDSEARRRLDAAFERLRQANVYPAEKIKPGAEAAKTLYALSDYEAGRGNFAKAIEIDEKLLGRMIAWGVAPDSDLSDAIEMSRIYGTLAELHRRVGQAGRESDYESRRVALWRQWNGRLPHNSFVSRQLNAAAGSINGSIADVRTVVSGQ